MRAHERWGGGKEIVYSEMLKLLELIVQAQQLSDKIAEALYEHVPASVKQEEDGWYVAERKPEGREGSFEVDVGNAGDFETMSPLMKWTHSLIRRPQCTVLSGGHIVESTREWDSSGEAAFIMEVPGDLADKFNETFIQVSFCLILESTRFHFSSITCLYCRWRLMFFECQALH